jgi:hypothetical protein
VAKRRRREKNHKQESKGMRDDYQCKTKKIFVAVKHHGATVMDVVSILAHAALKTVHHAPVVQTVKQIIQLFREWYTET